MVVTYTVVFGALPELTKEGLAWTVDQFLAMGFWYSIHRGCSALACLRITDR